MLNIAWLQRHIPASVKNFLKPHYRRIFPNRLHVLFWPTFRCNYKCSYCTVVTKFNYGDLYPRESERTVDEWLAAFAKLPPAMVYVSGGEPFLYRGLPEFVNRLERHTILGIVSNATVSTHVYRQIKAPLHLNVSFHREYATEEAFLAKLVELQPYFHLNVNIVATPENLPVIEHVRRRLEGKKISLHVDPLVTPGFEYEQRDRQALDAQLTPDRKSNVTSQLNFADYETKECSAGKNYINVLPNGDVFACFGGASFTHSPLVADILARGPDAPYDLRPYRMGNLFDADFRLRDAPMSCSLPCLHACDFDSATIRRLGPAARPKRRPRRSLPVIQPRDQGRRGGGAAR